VIVASIIIAQVNQSSIGQMCPKMWVMMWVFFLGF